jgi:hypothetical protein
VKRESPTRQQRASGGAAASPWKRALALLGTIAVALLPKCPVCWSVYAGLSGVLGLSFAVETRYLFPITLALLGLSVWLLTGRRARGNAAWVLGLCMAAGVLIAKFVIDSEPWLYASMLGLVLTTSWAGGFGSRLAGIRFRTAR